MRHFHWLSTLPVICTLAAPAAAFDLTVGEIAVNQGLVDPVLDIPLIAERSLAVRVTVDVADPPGGGTVAGISGNLTITVDGQEITPAGGIAPINAPFEAGSGIDPADESGTLNFEILAPTGIGASEDVDISVELLAPAGETDDSNNTTSLSDLTFIDTAVPSIFYMRVFYGPAGLSLFPENLIAPNSGADFIRGTYPVNDADPALYRDGQIPSMIYDYSCNGDDQIDVDCTGLGNGPACSLCEHEGLFLELECRRQLIVENGIGATQSSFLYGWVQGNPINGNGYASQDGGRVAFGNTQSQRFQKTFAHEIGHLLLGTSHTTDQTVRPGWDIGSRIDSPENPFPSAARLRPAGLSALMDTDPTSQTWILEQEYLDLIDAIDAASQLEIVPDGLFLAGVFNPRGTHLQLDPVFQWPWPSQPTPVPRGRSQFVLELTDEKGNSRRAQFNARFSDETGRHDTELFGAFSLVVAQPEVPLSMLRVLKSDGTVVAQRRRSKPPKVRIDKLADSVLPARLMLEWTVEDPDTFPDEMLAHIAWSPDEGRSFRPLAARVRGQNVTVDTHAFAAAEGTGLIRVFVSDGMNTSFADLTGLSTPNY